MFRRYHDPGLPSWPPLYVDAKKQNAFIKMRIADWVAVERGHRLTKFATCLLYTSPSPRDRTRSRMPSSA